MCQITNNTTQDFSQLENLITDFVPFAQERMGFHSPPALFLNSDPENGSDPLGKTAFYDPSETSITIFTDGRHPKDMLRSFAHELVHHTQNLRGDFDQEFETGPGYAQKDPHLRQMESEAYEVGNLCFRDWEDDRKHNLNENTYYNTGENKKMSLKDWKNKTVSSLLMKKFNLLKEDLDPAANWYGDTLSTETSNENNIEDDVKDEDEEWEASPHAADFNARDEHKTSGMIAENIIRQAIRKALAQKR